MSGKNEVKKTNKKKRHTYKKSHKNITPPRVGVGVGVVHPKRRGVRSIEHQSDDFDEKSISSSFARRRREDKKTSSLRREKAKRVW